MADAYEHIATTTLGSDTASVTFSSLGSYEHLQIRASARSTLNTTPGYDGIDCRFNSDAGANYDQQGLHGFNSADAQDEHAGINDLRFWAVASDPSNSNLFGGFVLNILDYRNTNKNTSVRVYGCRGPDSSNGFVFFGGALWEDTSAVTSVLLAPQSGSNWKSGSSFDLYGLRSS